MAKDDSFAVGLTPALALAAALFSGTLLRVNGPSEQPKQVARPEHAQAPSEQAAEGPSPRLADLRPVMELLGQALGVSVEPDETLRAVRALHLDSDRRGGVRAADAAKALGRLEDFLARRASTKADVPDADSVQLLDAYLRSDVSPEARFHKLQSLVADRFFADLSASEALRRLCASLHRGRPSVDVKFLVATIPDYVNSNSGWVADETIGAIQLAMARAGFLLDRFRLIDWSRADDGRADRMTNDSRLHERQPGALIFRKVESDQLITFQVVLLVLETPTTGVQRTALRNAMHFVLEWSKKVDPQAVPALRILAPIFSGSALSLALELKNLEKLEGSRNTVSVVTGSAMADVNPCIVNHFAPRVSYFAAVQPTSAVMKALNQSLGQMNKEWGTGRHVALLVESNTSFGESAFVAAHESVGSSSTPIPTSTCIPQKFVFPSQAVYRFPLHVAQLRSDAPPSPAAAVSFLPTPIVPLSFRETTPAADQLPPLRPQLASAVAEVTVSNILNNIRYEKLSAVGIVATDSRDALFLAREVKKAAPDVQLFFAGSYLLYLHPEYLPYTRGAVVASPYPLALANQRRIHTIHTDKDTDKDTEREAFPSLIAAGVFNATLMQLQQSHQLVDYCDPGVNFAKSNPGWCAPPVWVTVIGDDGYWPLMHLANTSTFVPELSGTPPPFYRQLPLTTPEGLIGIVLVLIIGGLLWAAAHLVRRLGKEDRQYLGIPFLRVLAPPVTYRSVARLHSLAVFLCAVVLACLGSWLVTILTLHRTLQMEWAPRAVSLVAWTVFAVVVAPAGALLLRAQRLDSESLLNCPTGPRAPQRPWNKGLMFLSLILVFGAVWYFLVFLKETTDTVDSADTSFKVARFMAGGIVSPFPVTICMFGALFIGMVSGVRRLSLVGNGYTALAHESPAFRLLAGAPQEGPGSALSTDPASQDSRGRDLRQFVALLDMPVQNLPRLFLICIIALIAIIGWSVGWVSTVDGLAFSHFVTLATLAILVTAILLVGQAAATWSALQPKLARLARTRIERALGVVGHTVRWELSIVPPRLSELMPLASRADRLRDGMLAIANRHLSQRVQQSFPNRRVPQSVDLLSAWCSASLLVRPQDLSGLTAKLSERQTDQLRDEIVRQKTAPLLQSRTWFGLWRISDKLVTLLEQVHWRRCTGTASDATAAVDVSEIADGTSKCLKASASSAIERWFNECEDFVALQYAFLLRDVLARIMSSLFAAMLCLTLLSAAHLFYLFQGRSSFLAIDLLALLGVAAAAIPIVVGMERDAVLSRLRMTTPGRIDFNWDFVKRVGLYGVLPLLAVIGSLFPEIGSSFFGWLEPLRKLAF